VDRSIALQRHNFLFFRFISSGTIERWSFTSPDAEERTVGFEPKGKAVFNDDENMPNAATLGVGVRQHLADGRLVRCARHSAGSFPSFYLYVPSRDDRSESWSGPS